jgi:putative ABC transport system substrate-binding protein
LGTKALGPIGLNLVGLFYLEKTMRREFRFFIVIAAVLALYLPAQAQQPARIPKIGIFGVGTAASFAPSLLALRQELRALGYIEGKNIVIESRYADNKPGAFAVMSDELVRLKVDVILTPGTLPALSAKNATGTIPIVFYFVGDPVAAGLVDSLARPGGNVTGFSIIAPMLAGKRLEVLKETIPKLARIALLWNPQDPASAQQWKESQLPARELGLQLRSMEVSSVDKYEAAFNEATKARSAALAVTLHGLANNNQKQIVDLAAKNRLPAIYARRDYVERGGMMSYGADNAEPYRRAAVFVDKILKGAKPADLPVEQPTKFELVINLKTARQIGLTIPPNVLARADKVIK